MLELSVSFFCLFLCPRGKQRSVCAEVSHSVTQDRHLCPQKSPTKWRFTIAVTPETVSMRMRVIEQEDARTRVFRQRAAESVW